ncbi:MAG: 5'/3'-nucleotidase SurE [Clostridiales Family XIII bacterium]|jgi:5'-nucleotidase|nr:5'/3'-nucleotidase SurE [Clostridiales Family XIII bacterium]
MNILVTNDDGILAQGIRELADALSEIADIYVCAPHTQRSGSGHAITIERAVTAQRTTFPKARGAIRLEGTPADCVKMGLEIFSDEGVVIDKVFSGINHGANMGTDTLYSGTVSAALEGSLCGLPSAAVSIDARNPLQFDTARELAVKVAKTDFSALDEKAVININVPNLPKDEIRGVKVTGLGLREYNERYEKIIAEDGTVGYRYSGYPVYYEDLGKDANDVGAAQAGYATITPLRFDLTNYDLIDKLRACGFAD